MFKIKYRNDTHTDTINILSIFFFVHRLKIIEEERLKLLKEHAAELIGYFPPGILRETDLAHLNM